MAVELTETQKMVEELRKSLLSLGDTLAEIVEKGDVQSSGEDEQRAAVAKIKRMTRHLAGVTLEDIQRMFPDKEAIDNGEQDTASG